jgi:predicted nuclease of predicted toxin-antitoxin system
MMLLADESVNKQIVDRLRDHGHEIISIAELAPSIKDDDQVLDEANNRHALLLTADKDFGDLVYRLGKVNEGVVLVRLSGLPPESKAQIVAKVLQDHASELPGAFSVISPGGVRIRKRPKRGPEPLANGQVYPEPPE